MKNISDNIVESFINQVGEPVPLVLNPHKNTKEFVLDTMLGNLWKSDSTGVFDLMFPKLNEDGDVMQHIISHQGKIQDVVPEIKVFLSKYARDGKEREILEKYINMITDTIMFMSHLMKQSNKNAGTTQIANRSNNVNHNMEVAILSNGILPFNVDNFLNTPYYNIAKLSTIARKLFVKRAVNGFRYYTTKDLTL